MTKFESDSKLSLARALAERGLYIAPLQPESKLPYSGESWSRMRSRDPRVIEGWFNDPARQGMNYAVIPGEGYVVLDLDTKRGKDGAGDLDAIAMEHDDVFAVVETFTVKTPSGGEHRYFKAPWPVSVAHALPRSIDVRGMDGYVVGPGCHTKHNPVTGTMEGGYDLSQGGLFGGDDEKYARIASKIDKQGPAGLRNLASMSIVKGGDEGRLVAAAIVDRLNSMSREERDSVGVSINQLADFHCGKAWRAKTARLQEIKTKVISIIDQYRAQVAFTNGTKANPDRHANDKIKAGLAAHDAKKLRGQLAADTSPQVKHGERHPNPWPNP